MLPSPYITYKMVASVLFLLLVLSLNIDASYIQLISPHPGHPDECPLGDGTYLKVGERLAANENGCGAKSCSKRGNQIQLYVGGCVYRPVIATRVIKTYEAVPLTDG